MRTLLLGFVALVLCGCQGSDERATSKIGQIAANKVSPISPSKDCPYGLSQSFRDAAGDAFDKLQSLESNELQGKLFYQPAYQEAGVGVSKVERVASNSDEVQFSNVVTAYLSEINLYRQETELANTLRKGERLARDNSEIMPDVYAQHPELRPTMTSTSVLQKVAETEELQKKHRAIIGACLNASHEATDPSDSQPLIDKRRKLENEHFWAERDAAAAASKRKVKKEPQFVDEPRSKP